MSSVLRARSFVAPRHLGSMLSAYADRRLPAPTLLTCDQHVAICPGCLAAVSAERRLLGSLRSAVTPGPPSRLESALLDLAVHAMSPGPASVPPSLALVGRAAPAMHRSPVRAAMLASLAAGASAAAAWSLGVTGVGPSGASLPVVRLPDPALTASSSSGNGSSSQAASFLSANRIAGFAGSLGFTTTFTTPSTQTVPDAGQRPAVPDISRRWAQSTHE